MVEVELHNGMIGVGLSVGGEAACNIIETHLHRFVEGQVGSYCLHAGSPTLIAE